MKAPTQRDCLVAALKARDFEPYPKARTRKYDVWWKPDSGDKLWFIGRAGALRIGRTLTGSVPSRNRELLLAEGRAILEKS